jgi:hypothetical protein
MADAVANGHGDLNDAVKSQNHRKKGNMTRTKYIIASVIGIGACTGLSLHLIEHHARSAAASAQELASYAAPASYPGNATPESALQSLGWAAGKGDLPLLRDGVAPNIQQLLDGGGGPNFPSHAMSMATELAGGKILKKEVLSDNQVLLHVQPEGRDNAWEVRMQKVGSSWKLAELHP